jgi:thioredoxin-dependent peroxiredoxin
MKTMLAGLAAAVATAASAGELKIGEAAPDFSAASTAGEVKLADFKGKWLVLYFYPKSFTPGCTKESCSLRDGFADLQALGAAILGSSFDDVETQKKFKAEHQLPFELLADTKKEVAKAYDSVMIGGLMSARKTYIVSPDGKLAAIIGSVNTGDHDGQVAEELKKLQAAAKPDSSGS